MDSVKVRTPSDFHDRSLSPKRKKHSTIACGHCRKLKIRCQGGNRGLSQPCEYCAQHSRKCDWPEEDGRKLKRQRSRSDSLFSGHSASAAPDSLAGLAINEDYAANRLPVLDEHRANNFNQQMAGPGEQLPHGQFTPDGMLNHTPQSGTHRSGSSASETPYTTVHYYRHHGPTAIAPGHKQISLKARQDEDDTAHDDQLMIRAGQHVQCSHSYHHALFDTSTGLPKASILPQLIDTFFDYYGDIYCFLNKNRLIQLINEGRPPVFLICAMSALCSRFCQPELFLNFFPPLADISERKAWEYSFPFLERAKSMVMSAISLPTTEVVAGLLLLAFADFGDNNEAGLWMFTGMALRMAQELGFQRQRPSRTQRRESQDNGDAHAAKEPRKPQCDVVDVETFNESSEIVLFWAVFAHDVALCNGTGRVPSMKHYEINARLPTNQDVAIIRAGPGGRPISVSPAVYPEMARMMLGVAQSVDFLNTGASQISHHSKQEDSDRLARVEGIKASLIRTYRSLPKQVSFGAIYYQSAVAAAQAGPYLLLHLQYHLQIAFLSQESLAETSGTTNTNPPQPVNNVEKTKHDLYKSSIKAITDLLTIAKLIDDRPVLTVVYLNQAFFHSACAFSRDMIEEHDRVPPSEELSPSAFPIPNQTSPSMVFPQHTMNIQRPRSSHAIRRSTRNFLALIARTNYQFLRQAIKDQAQYYAGSGWVDAVLDQRETGLRDVDLTIVSDAISTFIRLHGLPEAAGSEIALQKFVPQTYAFGDPANTGLEASNINWEQMPAELFANGPLNFDPQAFFTDYMYNEQSNLGGFGVGSMDPSGNIMTHHSGL